MVKEGVCTGNVPWSAKTRVNIGGEKGGTRAIF